MCIAKEVVLLVCSSVGGLVSRGGGRNDWKRGGMNGEGGVRGKKYGEGMGGKGRGRG